MSRFHVNICLLVLSLCGMFPSGMMAQDVALPDENNLSRLGMKMHWWNQAEINPRKDFLEYVVADEHSVFAQSNGGMVTCFDAETGKKQWSRLMSKFQEKMFPLSTNRDYVTIAVGRRLVTLKRFSGELVWEVDLPDVPSTGPASDEVQVYVGMVDGGINAVDIAKILEYTKKGVKLTEPQLIQSWRYKTGKAIVVPPIVMDYNIIFASMDKSVYSVTPLDRKLAFQFETDGRILTPMETDGTNLYIASDDSNFYCLKANNGQLRWSYVSPSPLRAKPIANNNAVYLLLHNNGLKSFNTKDGSEIWSKTVPNVNHILSINRNFVCGMNIDGRIVMINKQNGTIAGSIPPSSFNFPVSNDRTDRLILATKTGLITSIKLVDQEFPIFHRYPERRPVVPIFESENPEQEK